MKKIVFLCLFCTVLIFSENISVNNDKVLEELYINAKDIEDDINKLNLDLIIILQQKEIYFSNL